MGKNCFGLNLFLQLVEIMLNNNHVYNEIKRNWYIVALNVYTWYTIILSIYCIDGHNVISED